MLNFKNKLKLTKIHFLAIVIIVAGTLVASYFIYQNKERTEKVTSAGWVEYRSEEHKIKFNYLKSWGNPQIEVNKLSKGIVYSVLFGVSAEDKRSLKQDRNVKIVMETEDVIKKVCEEEDKCNVIPAVTKSYVQQRLEADKSSYVTYNSTSYTILSIGTPGSRDSKGNQGINNIAIYKKVNLQKLNVSAVQGYYSKKANINNCPQNQFGQETDGCITQENYDYLNKVLSSIRPL